MAFHLLVRSVGVIRDSIVHVAKRLLHSYWEPLSVELTQENQDRIQNELRLLQHSYGDVQDMQLQLSQMFGFGEKPPPPAAKEFVRNMKSLVIKETGQQCTVCFAEMESGTEVNVLPCGHKFHPPCIPPWLEEKNTCPLCRYELPTDDEGYEAYRKLKKLQELLVDRLVFLVKAAAALELLAKLRHLM